ncbi:energy-coupling factor ABC transporter ATP-binding protein [Halorutilales archaeon Cl-col2-1]
MTDRQDEVLSLRCKSHTYPDGTTGIHEVEFEVFEDETVFVCGGNGAGKSTLLEHLNGILTPDDGELRVKGEEIDDSNLRQARREVGLVFQDSDSQIIAPTVIDDVSFGPKNYGATDEEAERRAEEALDSLDALGLRDRSPHYLSGGEKRIVALAGVLAMNPSVVVMDEPFAGLDPTRTERLIERIGVLREDGISVVVSTHDIDSAARMADRVFVMNDGNTVAEGKPREVFYDYELLDSANLRPPSAVRLARELGVDGERPITQDEVVRLVRESSLRGRDIDAPARG